MVGLLSIVLELFLSLCHVKPREVTFFLLKSSNYFLCSPLACDVNSERCLSRSLDAFFSSISQVKHLFSPISRPT